MGNSHISQYRETGVRYATKVCQLELNCGHCGYVVCTLVKVVDDQFGPLY